MINYNECDVRDTEYFKAFIFKNSSGEECLTRLMINQADNGILDLNKFEELKDIVVVGFRNVEFATVVSDDYFDTLVLPHWVERINGCAFRGLKVRHVIWPDSCPLIPYGAFLDSSIKVISNIDSVRALGDEAFKNSKLKSITIPEQVSRIPFCCFSHCGSLSEVKGMENVRIIFSGAFSCCENLHSISLDKVVNESTPTYATLRGGGFHYLYSTTGLGAFGGRHYNMFVAICFSKKALARMAVSPWRLEHAAISACGGILILLFFLLFCRDS